jgi:guanylate kinase
VKPRILILSGASGSGKTTLLNSIAKISADGATAGDTVRAAKFAQRARRDKPGEVDDITHTPSIRLGEFDIAYVINNVRYGIKLDPIRDLLRRGLNAVIVLSDFRVVRQMKALFPENAVAIYVSSAIDADRLRRVQQERLGFSPSEQQKSVLAYHFARTLAAARLGWWDRVSNCMTDLESYWHAYATDSKSTAIRAEKIRAFHIRYIEHISLFDHVVLNYAEDRPAEMTEQVTNLLSRIEKFERLEKKASPPIFVVAAASGAGKGILMETLDFIGSDRVKIVSKLAKRSYKSEDKRDGMIALFRKPGDPAPDWPSWWTADMVTVAEAGEFPAAYDLRWEFHKHSQGRGTEYAVSSVEIERNLADGLPQIFVSNVDQFETFRTAWPDNAVFVYLHRLVSDQDYFTFQTNKWQDDPKQATTRIAEKARVHEQYISRIAEFDHVLLNTGYEEDLYDQMFRLLEFYASHADNSDRER